MKERKRYECFVRLASDGYPCILFGGVRGTYEQIIFEVAEEFYAYGRKSEKDTKDKNKNQEESI